MFVHGGVSGKTGNRNDGGAAPFAEWREAPEDGATFTIYPENRKKPLKKEKKAEKKGFALEFFQN